MLPHVVLTIVWPWQGQQLFHKELVQHTALKKAKVIGLPAQGLSTAFQIIRMGGSWREEWMQLVSIDHSGNLHFLYFFYIEHIYSVCVCTARWSWFFLSTMWVPETELSISSLAIGTFTNRVIPPIQKVYFCGTCFYFCKLEILGHLNDIFCHLYYELVCMLSQYVNEHTEK